MLAASVGDVESPPVARSRAAIRTA